VTCFGTTTRVSISEPKDVQTGSGWDTEESKLTRTIDAQPITSKRKDLTTSRGDGGLGKILAFADVLDKFHHDFLYELKCRFPTRLCE